MVSEMISYSGILPGYLDAHKKLFLMVFVQMLPLSIDEVGMTYDPQTLSFMEVTSLVFIVMGLPFSWRYI